MKMKKVLAAVLAGTMVMASVVSVSAATSLSDVTSTTWWEVHSDGIEIADGSTVTITFTQTSDSDSSEYYHCASYVIYTADAAYDSTDSTDHNDISGYAEYYVCRGDVYGFDGTSPISNECVVDEYPDWDAWLTDLMAGVESTVVLSRSGDTVTGVYTADGGQTTSTISVDSSLPVYVDLTGEKTTITNISYDVESASSNNSDDNNSDDNNSDDNNSDDNNTSNDNNSDDNNTSNDNNTSDDNSSDDTTGTGDAAPIAATVVALLGCAAIVVASRKKMA